MSSDRDRPLAVACLAVDPSCGEIVLKTGPDKSTVKAALTTADISHGTRLEWFSKGGLPAAWAVLGSSDSSWLGGVADREAAPAVRAALARNPHTPRSSVKNLLEDADPRVRAFACANPNSALGQVRKTLLEGVDLGTVGTYPQQFMFAASVLRAHPGLVGYFCKSSHYPFRAAAARMPGLKQDDIQWLYNPSAGRSAGKQAFKTNPLTQPGKWTPTWAAEGENVREASRHLIDTDGELRGGVSAVEAANAGSDTVDLAAARVLDSFNREDLAKALQVWSTRGAAIDVQADAMEALPVWGMLGPYSVGSGLVRAAWTYSRLRLGAFTPLLDYAVEGGDTVGLLNAATEMAGRLNRDVFVWNAAFALTGGWGLDLTGLPDAILDACV